MKKILIAVMLFLGIGLQADDINLWKNSTLNKILQRGELRIGMEPGYMPFEMKDKKGKIIGFDVDMVRLMAKSMGVKLKLVPTAWDGIIGGLMAGKYDMIVSGITITQERNLKINFSNPYITVGQTMIVASKHKGKTWKDLDDEKYTVVTKLGVTGEIVTRKMFKKAKIKTFDTEADAAQEVLNGNADAFIYDKPYNMLFMAQKGGSGVIHFEDDLSYEPLGFAIRKGDPDFMNWLNNFLFQIKGDGRHETLYKKWFKDSSWLKRVK
ncbi:MAG: amino acid ABC transporter substrate-binding protein [Proteobacteria bacterium]|nr:MAG: amino acid ABC transporter substrate-binding protein [Pseudomonadota bacterium]